MADGGVRVPRTIGGVGGPFEKKILMFFKNKKVRIFVLTSPKALELLVKMTVSELDYQQISVLLKQGLRGKGAPTLEILRR